MTAPRHAFSLMELLAVVAILGVIAAIIIPRITDASSDSKVKVTAHQIRTLANVCLTYRVEHGEWPPTGGPHQVPVGLEPYLPEQYTLLYTCALGAATSGGTGAPRARSPAGATPGPPKTCKPSTRSWTTETWRPAASATKAAPSVTRSSDARPRRRARAARPHLAGRFRRLDLDHRRGAWRGDGGAVADIPDSRVAGALPSGKPPGQIGDAASARGFFCAERPHCPLGYSPRWLDPFGDALPLFQIITKIVVHNPFGNGHLLRGDIINFSAIDVRVDADTKKHVVFV